MTVTITTTTTADIADGPAMVFSTDILSNVLSYMEVKEVPSVVLVNRQFQQTVQTVQPSICQAWVHRYYPDTEPLIQRLPAKYRCEWSRYVQQGISIQKRHEKTDNSATAAGLLNQRLQDELELLFHPGGVLPFSNCCCNPKCPLSEYHGFQFRQDFSLFFRLYLDGALLGTECDSVTAVITNCIWKDAVTNRWFSDIDCLIKVWCAALGKNESEYAVALEIEKGGRGKLEIKFDTPISKIQPSPFDTLQDRLLTLVMFTMTHALIDRVEELEEEEPEQDDGDVVEDDYDEDGEESVEEDDASESTGCVLSENEEVDDSDDDEQESAMAEEEAADEAGSEEEWYSCDEDVWFAAEADY